MTCSSHANPPVKITLMATVHTVLKALKERWAKEIKIGYGHLMPHFGAPQSLVDVQIPFQKLHKTEHQQLLCLSKDTFCQWLSKSYTVAELGRLFLNKPSVDMFIILILIKEWNSCREGRCSLRCHLLYWLSLIQLQLVYYNRLSWSEWSRWTMTGQILDFLQHAVFKETDALLWYGIYSISIQLSRYKVKS